MPLVIYKFIKKFTLITLTKYIKTGQVDTYSFIYKFSVEHSKFVVSQRLRSHAAVDLKYFELAESGKTERFLVLANLYMQKVATENGTEPVGASDSETHSIIYKYTNDFFTPFQSILLYDVEQFLPVLVTHLCGLQVIAKM